jgi:hypothetical protein
LSTFALGLPATWALMLRNLRYDSESFWEDNGLYASKEWFKQFKEGWMLVESDERSGRPPQAETK